VEVRVARFLHLPPVHGLGRDHVRVDEVAQLLLEIERPGAELEVHQATPSLPSQAPTVGKAAVIARYPHIRTAGGVELLG
jgi:hypothetical protein